MAAFTELLGDDDPDGEPLGHAGGMQEPRIVKRSVNVGFVLCLCSFLNHVVALVMLLLPLATGSSTRLVSENPVSRVAGHFSTRLVPKIVQQCIFPEVARRLHLARTERVPIEVDLMSKAMLDSIGKQRLTNRPGPKQKWEAVNG